MLVYSYDISVINILLKWCSLLLLQETILMTDLYITTLELGHSLYRIFAAKMNYISGKQWVLGNSLIKCLHLPVCQHRAYGLFELHQIPSLHQLHHTKQRQQKRLNDTGNETHRDAHDSMNVSPTSE